MSATPSPDGAEDPRAASRALGDELRGAVKGLDERIEAILESTERAVAEIQQRAEASARREADERRREVERELQRHLAAALATLSERRQAAESALRERVRAVEQLGERAREETEKALEELHGLERALADMASATGADSGSAEPEGPATAPPLRSVDPPPEADRLGDAEAQVPAGALLRAAQMAVAGSDRAQIEKALKEEFGAESTDAIVDEVLGSD